MDQECWDDDCDDESKHWGKGSLLKKMSRWLRGDSDEEDRSEEDLLQDEIAAARHRVEEHYASANTEPDPDESQDHSRQLSLERSIAENTERLAQYLERFDEACNRMGSDAIIDQDVLARRIARLNQALADAERTRDRNKAAYDDLEERRRDGRMSQAYYDDHHHDIARKEQRATTRTDLGGLGGSYDDIGDVGDQSSHILDDALADDDGGVREAIYRKIRRMPRQMALEILENAVADGIISQETADYLLRRCVRPSG